MKFTSEAELEKTFGAARMSVLCDGRSGIRGGMRVAVKTPEGVGDEPILDFAASDETIDRYDEVIAASGWQLDNYHKNPVFQNSHKYGDVAFTLGKAMVTQVIGSGLYQRVKFATDVNPMAKIAHGLYAGGYLNAVSVGFIPREWEPGAAGSGVSRKYTRQELLEVSAVSIPANPNALVMGIKSGAVSEEDVKEVLEMARAFLSASKEFSQQRAGSGTHASASSAGTHEAQLLHLARSFGDVLKGK